MGNVILTRKTICARQKYNIDFSQRMLRFAWQGGRGTSVDYMVRGDWAIEYALYKVRHSTGISLFRCRLQIHFPHIVDIFSSLISSSHFRPPDPAVQLLSTSIFKYVFSHFWSVCVCVLGVAPEHMPPVQPTSANNKHLRSYLASPSFGSGALCIKTQHFM